MKKLVNFVVLIGLLGLTTSCLEEVDVPMVGTEANTVSFIIEDFIPEAQTKSAFQTPTMKFRWSEDDVIGIFPEDGWQTQFNMESGAGGNTAVFDGGSWGLKDDATYYAYYPFSKENFSSMDCRESVMFTYDGQYAAFADGDGVVDVSGYDFMASGASTVDNGAVSFRFRHLGALCRVRFVAPAAAEYSHVDIEANDEVFLFAGNYDATDKDGDGVISYVSEISGESLSLPFPSGHQAYEAGENVEFYFLMAPTDLSEKILTFRLVDNGNNEYEAEVAGKEILAGGSYSWDVVWPGGEGETPGDGTPATDETANCYIVSEPGTYSFPTVMGNSSESVGVVATAEVLWESFGTDVVPDNGVLVNTVSYSNGHISYTVPSPFREGNAVIAAKDVEGTILWSWHIWLTDKPKDQIYVNNAGTMMDRNLGATSATPGDVGALGLFYQWGRKDPFLGSSSISSTTVAASTLNPWPSPEASTETVGTISYAIANPTVFIQYNEMNWDWYFSGEYEVTDNTRWQSTKTVYDPCPAGYRVPDGGENGVWYKAFGIYDLYDEAAYDSTNKGFNFIEGSMTDNYYLTDEESCWYPTAGYLDRDDGSLKNAGSYGNYWSCTPDIYTGCTFYFDSEGSVIPFYINYCASGHSVRCTREAASSVTPEPTTAVDLSEKGTANSYIVSELGTYSFPTVKGNSSESVGEVSAVDVLWETYGTDEVPEVGALISKATYADNTITFHASDKKGNAVIAAKDGAGKILWSWHIWLTDKPKDQIYVNNAGTMMDRNLGATSATPGDVGALGLFYQWGRKDPFLGSSSISESVVAKSTLASWPSPVASTESVGTISYAIANPTTFILYNDNNKDWYFSEEEDITDDTRWQSVKIVYDPCPVGYRVPNGGYDGIWYKAFGCQNSYFRDEASYDSTNKGFNFIEGSMTNYYLTDEDTCWYPAAGYLSVGSGSFYDTGSGGSYWSCTAGYYAYHLDFDDDGFVYPPSYNYRASGYSVRCQKE